MSPVWISGLQPTFRERARQGRFNYIIVQVFHAVAGAQKLDCDASVQTRCPSQPDSYRYTLTTALTRFGQIGVPTNNAP